MNLSNIVKQLGVVALLAATSPALVMACPAHKASIGGTNAEITHIESRGNKITVTSTEDGPKYTVKDKSGKVLAKESSLSELQAKAPEVYTIVKSAIASTSDSTLDARVN